MCGSTVIRKIGLSTIVAMPRTFMVPCVLSHSVSSTVMPPIAMSALPEMSASLAAGPELNLLMVTLGGEMPRRTSRSASPRRQGWQIGEAIELSEELLLGLGYCRSRETPQQEKGQNTRSRCQRAKPTHCHAPCSHNEGAC